MILANTGGNGEKKPGLVVRKTTIQTKGGIGMYCSKCGNTIPDDSLFCPFCGSRIRQSSIESKIESDKGLASENRIEIEEKTPDGDAPPEISEDFADKAAFDQSSIEKTEQEERVTESPAVFEHVTSDESQDVAARKNNMNFGRKKKVIVGTVGLIIVLTAIIVPVASHNAKIKQYNEGVTHLENKKYEEAVECFSQLGSFEDSEKMAEYAQMEMDYLTLDELKNSGDYERIVEILHKRGDFYGSSDTGKKAQTLADDYETISKAYTAKTSEDYSKALELFDSLTILADDWAEEKCLCTAHIAEEEQDWAEIINNLYAIQSEDYEFDFLSNPQNDAEFVLSASYNWDADETVNMILEILQPENSEGEQLKTAALNGLCYDEAKKQLDFGNYEKAMTIFEKLGDFLDSEDCYEESKRGYESFETTYQQAEAYYNNKEFFKAQELYLSISEYKDAQDKAQSCEQPLPENGSLKSGNGSSTDLTIKVPDQNESVFLKLYDADGNAAGQVFIRPGKSATVNMKGGTYTMKVAYGTKWYGEIDLFGTSGSYQQLLNGSSTAFKLDSGYSYTLTLGGVSDGNVGSKSIGGASGM